jgi:tetratricopeptide (TPR) repeat protein
MIASNRVYLLVSVVGAVSISAALAWPSAGRSPEHDIALTTSEVRYRFDVRANNPRADLEDTIAAVEARHRALPSDPLEMTELANLYFVRAQLDGDRRDYDAADKLARASLAVLPAPNGASLTLAKLANARHAFRDAIELAHSYKGRNPVGVPMVLATAYLALGELENAARAANEAVDAKPTPSTYLERALVLQAQGRDDEAGGDFANAVRLEDHGDVLESARIRTLWARFLVRRGRYADAKLVIDEALRISPGNALALSVHGELALRTGDPKRARADLEQAFVASHQVRYLIDRARAVELAGDHAGANALRTQVEGIVRDELATGGYGHRLELVETLLDRGDPTVLAEALAVARDEVQVRGSAEARFQLARALAWSGKRDEATMQIQAALATGAREAQYYELASHLELGAGHVARATTYMRLADSIDPASTGWRRLGLPR